MIHEKIAVVGLYKENMHYLYIVGQKIHDLLGKCDDSCACIQYLSQINLILESMEEPEATADQKLQFSEISLRNKKAFLLFDQINRKFLAEIFQLNDCCLKFAIYFELEKIKEYLKKTDESDKLEEKLYVISKSFL